MLELSKPSEFSDEVIAKKIAAAQRKTHLIQRRLSTPNKPVEPAVGSQSLLIEGARKPLSFPRLRAPRVFVPANDSDN